ncbi:hypothetical protein Tco_0681113 [Tanacetum coccineum]|uniref:Retrotransposon gag domain-containing protein n=1 Tax=Tanacetum coccineum TaxID=301880 RepID=A0ABQ4XMF3_9ASTR
MIDQGVTVALAARDADRSMNGDDNHNSGAAVRRTERITRECTYKDFMKCQTLFFKGTKGVVELTQWFKRMEIVFRISKCTVENQIKFATCTLLGIALLWWNSHVRTVGYDVMYAMTWTYLKKKMTNKYCPRGEIKKLKDAIEMATELMDKKINTFAEHQANNKRKFDDTSRNNQTSSRLPKGKMWHMHIVDLVRRNLMEVPNLCVLNATITMMVHVLPNATSATELAIWPMIVGVLQMPILPTTKGAMGQVRKLLATNLEPRDISRGSVQN